jgi:acyl-CoA synthetase (AMP-forming)/AMP-acid ligase II
MSPVSFLQKPARWLEAIDRYRATTSGGPNFAYDLCVRRVPEAARPELDLSSWRVAFNGAEPVRAETLRRFAQAFAVSGFRAEAFFPCYGLAEATLFVTGRGPDEPVRIEAFTAAELERGRAVPAEAGASDGEAPPARSLVSSGRPADATRVVVAAPETGGPRREGEVGEIWISGPGVASGYHGRPEDTREVFGARLAGEPDAGGDAAFLRTGRACSACRRRRRSRAGSDAVRCS